MKSFVVLCLLAVAVNGVQDLKDYIMNAQNMFHVTAASNPDGVIDQTLSQLTHSLGVADQLIKDDVISLNDAVEAILEGFETFMKAGAAVPQIQQFNEGVCKGTHALPFPDRLTAAFQEITDELNVKVQYLCNRIGMGF